MTNVQNHLKLKFLISLLIYFSISSTLYGQGGVTNLKSNKEIAISYINEVLNDRKINLVSDIFSPAFVFHEMDGKESHSISDSSLFAFLNYLFKAFPDLHYSIENVIAENDLVALSLIAAGTQKNEFLGYKASYNKIVFKEMFFFRLLNNRIVEGWVVVDVDGVKRQMAKQ